jgi:uncharacterized membrane protein YsdA (DUF1294 family)/cold shock CspA family protein
MTIESGKITSWKDDKGFGFITPKSGGKAIFIHISDFSRRYESPIKGLEVQYLISNDPKGRRCAVEVRPLKGHKKNSIAMEQRVYSIFFLISFAAILCNLFNIGLLPIEFIGVYTIMSVLAFIMYAKDKNAAERDKWRTPESTLHAISFVGGWPGAGISQSFLRHKSKKVSFRVTYWITVIANCGALWLLITPEGRFWLKNIVKNIR